MKRILLAAGLVAIVVAGVVAAFVTSRNRAEHDVRGSSTVEFVPRWRPTPPPPTGARDRVADVRLRRRAAPRRAAGIARRSRRSGGLDVPRRASSSSRRRSRTDGSTSRTTTAGPRRETETGKRAWSRVTGRCQATSPGVDRHLVYVTFLNGRRTRAGTCDGPLVACRRSSGHDSLATTIGPSESSPLLEGNVVRRRLDRRRLRVRREDGRPSGRTRRREDEGGLANADDQLFVGSYDSHVYALDAKTDKLVWKAGAQLASVTTARSTPRRPSPTDASTSARPTEALLVRRDDREDAVGEAPAVTSTPRRPSGATGSTSAPYDGRCSASTRPPATSSGSSTRTGRSRARRRS